MAIKITDIEAVQILDSRGNPTIKVRVITTEGAGEFSVPSGASTGIHEALELRDGGKKYNGQGITRALSNVTDVIKPKLIGLEVTEQRKVDELMLSLDGTNNKSKLGANAILGVSCAVSRAAAASLSVPLYSYLRTLYEQNGVWEPDLKLQENNFVLPDLFMNILNGGKHAENNVDIQETMIVPRAKTIAEKVRIGAEVYHSLKSVLKSRNLSVGLGDEGGFAPNLESNTKALDLLVEAIEKAGYTPGKEVSLALDVAASEIYEDDKDNKYILASEGIGLSSMQLVSLYKDLITNYPIVSIEDGLSEDDWEGWKMMTERIGASTELVGDDLFVTNTERIRRGIDEGIANGVLIKLNQIGSLTETFDAIKMAKTAGYKAMISHRSGETCDSFIADLVVATGTGQIKSGAPARGERTSKYNRLIEIEQELKEK